MVERRNGWFETSFMPGRSFTSPADFNAQFSHWLSKANARVVRTIKAAPVDLIDADRAAMLALPPIPLHLGWRNKIRLGRDYYVRLDTNDYSVDPTVIGRMVNVAADLERVRVRAEGRIVAEHARVWARGTTITNPAHVEVAGWLRKQFQQPRTVRDDRDDLTRDLSDYDRAFGLSDQEGIRGEGGGDGVYGSGTSLGNHCSTGKYGSVVMSLAWGTATRGLSTVTDAMTRAAGAVGGTAIVGALGSVRA